ncbi:MAG: hypothetical protein DMG57_25450 [Acidobacteria bacterium]|nr:MAG: hypothetical protein DMG57_25450 [Acidobacteriota bacterium]
MTANDDETRNSLQKHVYEIDGSAFSSLEGFFDEVSRKLIPDAIWEKTSMPSTTFSGAASALRKTALFCAG